MRIYFPIGLLGWRSREVTVFNSFQGKLYLRRTDLSKDLRKREQAPQEPGGTLLQATPVLGKKNPHQNSASAETLQWEPA